MYYNITYDICAVIVAGLAVSFFATRQKSTFLHNKVFLIMCIVSAVCPVFDILASYFLMHPDQGSLFLINSMNYMYMLTHNLLGFLYMLYIYTLGNMNLQNLNWGRRISLFVPITAAILIVLANPMSHAVFYVDSDMIYHRGDSIPFLYLISVYYATYGVLYSFKIKELVSGRIRITLWIYYVVAMGCVIFQFFYPEQLIESFGIACSLLLMLFAFQKPEDYVDVSIGIFDHNAFDRFFELRMKSKIEYRLLLISINDIRMIKQTVGVTSSYHILRLMGEYFRSVAGNDVFLITEDCFALAIDNREATAVTQLRGAINTRFQEVWEYNGKGIMAGIRMLSLQIPNDADEAETIYNYVDYIRDLDSTRKDELTARDINLEDGKRQRLVAQAVQEAIEYNRFEVYFQPIYSNVQERIRSAEALLRLNDPNIGAISPGEFIRIAEQNGMIHKVGEIVLDKVCAFIETSDIMDYGIEYIEVNLSAIQCMQEDLCERILNILNIHGVDPKRINLEITETATTNTPRLLYYNMKQLSDCGISFALDDFGTGYSNMNSLMGLPLELVKFDKTLIDMATESDRGKMILLSSVAMVKKMGLMIVAEGVETKEQLDFILEMGIDYVQGYYFSKPLPAAQFEAYVKRFNQ